MVILVSLILACLLFGSDSVWELIVGVVKIVMLMFMIALVIGLVRGP